MSIEFRRRVLNGLTCPPERDLTLETCFEFGMGAFGYAARGAGLYCERSVFAHSSPPHALKGL